MANLIITYLAICAAIIGLDYLKQVLRGTKPKKWRDNWYRYECVEAGDVKCGKDCPTHNKKEK